MVFGEGTALDGALSLRGRGKFASNCFVASADVHLHHKQRGIHAFAKPH